ncbi:MAG: hypothetical protein AB1510_08440 [Bacillota bacterium]
MLVKEGFIEKFKYLLADKEKIKMNLDHSVREAKSRSAFPRNRYKIPEDRNVYDAHVK